MLITSQMGLRGLFVGDHVIVVVSVWYNFFFEHNTLRSTSRYQYHVSTQVYSLRFTKAHQSELLCDKSFHWNIMHVSRDYGHEFDSGVFLHYEASQVTFNSDVYSNRHLIMIFGITV